MRAFHRLDGGEHAPRARGTCAKGGGCHIASRPGSWRPNPLRRPGCFGHRRMFPSRECYVQAVAMARIAKPVIYTANVHPCSCSF